MARNLISILAIFSGGFLVFAWDDLGMRLMWVIGYERALGAQNVVRGPNGSVLLTNPTAMIFWSLPFALIGLALMVVGLWSLCWRKAGAT